MEEPKGGHVGSEMVVAFLGGAFLGAGVALLLAPKSGQEMRSTLRGYAQKVEHDVEARVKDITSTIEACQRLCQEHVKFCREQLAPEGQKSGCA